MNLAAIAISWCLLAQVNDRYAPKLERSKGAPAAKFESGGEPASRPARARGPAIDDTLGGREPADEAPRFGSQQQEEAAPDSNLPAVDKGPRARLRPPELLFRALENPIEGALRGKPLTLLTAVSRSTDRQQQLKITQAYWRLCTAHAEYHWARDGRDRLKQFTEPHTNSPGTLSARAAARADVLDAELAVTQAQQELAELLGMQSEAALPLTTDRPHVGGYNLYYEAIFGNRPAPPRIRLVHRTLPLRQKSIDYHGEAIVAALDVVDASGEKFHDAGEDLHTLLAALNQLKLERRAFLVAVREYNQDIAEYLFTVIPAGTSDKVLVSKLVLNSERPAQPPAGRSKPRDSEAPAESPENNDQAALDDTTEAELRIANYQPDNSGVDESGVYEPLLKVSSQPLRVQKLASLLHWDRDLPPDAGQPVSLFDCLRQVAPDNRMALIAAYWRTREQAARYQALNDHSQQLNALSAVAIGMRDRPGIAEAGVRLQAARRSAHAAVTDAHVALLTAEYNLTQLAGRRVDEPWLLPATPPQSGGYQIGAQASKRQPHRAELLRRQYTELEERADSVIQCDAERAALLRDRTSSTDLSAGLSHLDRILWAAARQNHQTLDFLSDLTGYNIAIARYALAIMPAGISNDELVKMLVIARTARGDT